MSTRIGCWLPHVPLDPTIYGVRCINQPNDIDNSNSRAEGILDRDQLRIERVYQELEQAQLSQHPSNPSKGKRKRRAKAKLTPVPVLQQSSTDPVPNIQQVQTLAQQLPAPPSQSPNPVLNPPQAQQLIQKNAA
ncbi:hypothetical protein PsorP6_006058 [Peronosclerospora sorghi]|uniref:Uncharacterized protein n=1 Tax=Peronosclerospora sorghi TaxID=230839 RepID=A0ACC0W5G2_9STRA|nr:hypothetical protein PsorP6_006058 [Peronosclerospora sorghi]